MIFLHEGHRADIAIAPIRWAPPNAVLFIIDERGNTCPNAFLIDRLPWAGRVVQRCPGGDERSTKPRLEILLARRNRRVKAGKSHLAGEAARPATGVEIKELRQVYSRGD
jgi:hypothetical protein